MATPIPKITYPESLPVSARREEIARAIADHQVVIVCGETGSGKTTQLPKIALELGRGIGAGGRGLIGHTQPRRLAATSVAKRIADELQSPLGDVVGYKVRVQDRFQPGASVKLMTDGILLAETQGDPELRQYDRIAGRGLPVCVPIRGGKCGGCHLKVSNEVESGARGKTSDGRLATCDQCGRLVYWES